MKQYGIETLHEHQSSLEQKARFTGFPVLSEIFLPRSDRSWRADVLKTPRVSMAIGSKMYRPRPSRSAYFSSLREAASSAAAPDSRAAALMYDSDNGQVIVTSQHNALPLDQRTIIIIIITTTTIIISVFAHAANLSKIRQINNPLRNSHK